MELYLQTKDANFIIILNEREYFKSKEKFIEFLLKVPILDDFSEISLKHKKTKLDLEKIDEYICENTKEKGIVLKRNYYGITARK